MNCVAVYAVHPFVAKRRREQAEAPRWRARTTRQRSNTRDSVIARRSRILSRNELTGTFEVGKIIDLGPRQIPDSNCARFEPPFGD
jgi:hypothetical protein